MPPDIDRPPCSLCGGPVEGMGHNPEPLKTYSDRCCSDCNSTKVIPARIANIQNRNN